MIDLPSKIQNPKSKIAAVVLTRNEERHIGACLDSLAWADWRVVFDSFSTDRTCEIALEHGAEVMQHPFSNYAAQRNAAMESLDADWIFFVDADERGTPGLAEEIRAVLVQEGREIAGWYVPRRNYIFGKLTRGAGYWPDYQMRLLKRGLAHYERPASEVAELEGRSDYLKNPLIHYNYESVAQFHEKQTFRIDFEATNLYRQGVKSKFYTPYYMSMRHFWWRFVTLKGYQDGLHGLHLSLLLAYYFGYCYYARLGQMRRSSVEKPQKPPEV